MFSYGLSKLLGGDPSPVPSSSAAAFTVQAAALLLVPRVRWVRACRQAGTGTRGVERPRVVAPVSY